MNFHFESVDIYLIKNRHVFTLTLSTPPGLSSLSIRISANFNAAISNGCRNFQAGTYVLENTKGGKYSIGYIFLTYERMEIKSAAPAFSQTSNTCKLYYMQSYSMILHVLFSSPPSCDPKVYSRLSLIREIENTHSIYIHVYLYIHGRHGRLRSGFPSFRQTKCRKLHTVNYGRNSEQCCDYR